MDNDHTQWIWVLNQNFPVPHDNVLYNFYISKWYRAQKQRLVILGVHQFVLRYYKKCLLLFTDCNASLQRKKQTNWKIKFWILEDLLYSDWNDEKLSGVILSNFKQKIDFLPNQFFTLQRYETFYEHLQHFVKLSFFINSFPFVRRDLVENCNKNVKSWLFLPHA